MRSCRLSSNRPTATDTHDTRTRRATRGFEPRMHGRNAMASQQSAPFIIRMFLPNGTPDGIKIVEKSNWVGRAIAGPRSRFDELRKRSEFQKTGVYILTGQPDPDGLPTVYIGEGDPVADRLISHYKLKDSWSTAVFFIDNGKDDHLNKAHVQYLEARLASLAREAKRCVLDNANMPQLPALSEMDTAEADQCVSEGGCRDSFDAPALHQGERAKCHRVRSR